MTIVLKFLSWILQATSENPKTKACAFDKSGVYTRQMSILSKARNAEFGVFGGCLHRVSTVAAILSLLMTGTALGQESEDSRIEIEADIVGVLQSSPGYTGQFGDTDSSTEATVFFDLALTTRPWESGTAYARFKAGLGDGIDDAIPTFSIFNAAAIGSLVRLDEAWYEHAFGKKARLRGGKMDFTMIFDSNAVANDEYEQFLSDGFVNNIAVEFPDEIGLGAMLWVSPNTFFDIGVGLADAVGEWDDVFNSYFSILELGIKPEIAGKQGNYRVYGWHNSKDHARLISPESDTASNYGFGLSADQEIADGVTLFTRYGHQRGNVSPVEHAWSAGVGISGKFAGRGDDTLGLAYGQAIMGKDWKSLDQYTGMDSGRENRLEIYYNIKTNNYLNIAPNLQWVKNPMGDKENSSTWAFGVRAYLNLARGW